MRRIIMISLLSLLASIPMLASDKLKVWMNNPVMVADGKTVTYLTIYQTDEDDQYWNFEIHISLPEGIHIAKRQSGRKMVDDVTLNPDRFEDLPHAIAVNMPTPTSMVAICTNMASKVPYYNDDAEGNTVEELFTVGLIADEDMKNKTHEIGITVAKFVRTDVTGPTLNNPATSTMTITGGIDGDNSYSYTLSEAGYGTLVLPFASALPDGLKAYTCTTLNGNSVVMEEQSSLPANTPVVLKGQPGPYTFTGEGTAAEDTYTVGLLTGVYTATEITQGYVLQQQGSNVGFYSVDATNPKTVPANRCYLNVPSQSRMLSLNFDADGTTAIDATRSEQQSEAYDLSGRKVARKAKGVVVKDGVKVIRK